MRSRRFVFLDPDGTAGDWLYVVVEAPTGVCYQHQYGGNVNREGTVEGYLVPVNAPEALADARMLFNREFRGSGTREHAWTAEQLDQLRSIVARVRLWHGDDQEAWPHNLVLDENQITEVDEAWIPVITPDGHGVLVWNNSD